MSPEERKELAVEALEIVAFEARELERKLRTIAVVDNRIGELESIAADIADVSDTLDRADHHLRNWIEGR